MGEFVRLYYFINDHYGYENIKQRRLKISFADQVNDLFELKPFNFGPGDQGRERRFAWTKAIAQHALSQGFVSFTESWNVPTMWAHYADNHRGICLGFDLPKKLGEKVEYTKDLKQMDGRVLSDHQYNKDMIEYARKTKSNHWAYEKEWRYWFTLSEAEQSRKIRSPKEIFFVDFEKALNLREVVFGHRSNLTSSNLKEVIRPSDDVRLITARPSFQKFAMVEQQDDRLKK